LVTLAWRRRVTVTPALGFSVSSGASP